MALQVYHTNDERVQAEYEKDKNRGESFGNKVELYRLKKGITQLRIMPPWSEAGVWFKDFYEHYMGRVGRVSCPSTWDKNCPICNEGKRLYSSRDEADVERSAELKPKIQFLVNAIILSDPEGKNPSMGIVPVRVGPKTKGPLVQYDRDFTGGWGNMTSLTEGFDIRIERRGDGLGTEYFVTGVPKRTNIMDTLKAQGIDINTFTINDLDTILECPEEEHLQNMISSDFVPGFPSSPGPVEVGTPPPVETPAPIPAPDPPMGGTPTVVPGIVTPGVSSDSHPDVVVPSTTVETPTPVAAPEVPDPYVTTVTPSNT